MLDEAGLSPGPDLAAQAFGIRLAPQRSGLQAGDIATAYQIGLIAASQPCRHRVPERLGIGFVPERAQLDTP